MMALLLRPMCGWEYDTELHLKVVMFTDVKGTHPAQDKFQ